MLEISHESILTTLELISIIDGDSSLRNSNTDGRYTTGVGNVGEEMLIWILFTLIIINNFNSVVSSNVSCIELYELSTHSYIVVVNNSCVC